MGLIMRPISTQYPRTGVRVLGQPLVPVTTGTGTGTGIGIGIGIGGDAQAPRPSSRAGI